jgi:hypothetical protein
MCSFLPADPYPSAGPGEIISSPFKGEAGRGMGYLPDVCVYLMKPIPTPMPAGVQYHFCTRSAGKRFTGPFPPSASPP